MCLAGGGRGANIRCPRHRSASEHMPEVLLQAQFFLSPPREGARGVEHVRDSTCLRKPSQEVVQHTPSTSENLCTSSHLSATDNTM